MSEAEQTPTPKEYLASNVEFVNYKDESQLADVMELVLQDLSEPYSSKPNMLRSDIAFVQI
jgi:hypothetical protein